LWHKKRFRAKEERKEEAKKKPKKKKKKPKKRRIELKKFVILQFFIQLIKTA
jgi:nitrate reductase NapE component